MKNKWSIVLLVVMAVGVFMLMSRKPDLKAYEHLKNPKISTKPPQNMLVAEVKGDPSVTLKKGYAYIFRKLMVLKSGGKPLPMSGAPRGRYPLPAGTPREDWVSILAVPVPEMLDAPFVTSFTDGCELRLERWEYGEVAEVLHLGPYSAEAPALERLQSAIREKGYVITGPHEEEYIIGAGMGFFIRPKNYVTIIRYEVRKK